MKEFWSNTVWYLLLNAITAVVVILAIVKANRRKFAFAFYATVSGMVVVIFEQVVYLLARGYDYYPKILPSMPLYDNLMGKLSSQLSVSATALLIAVFPLNFGWILLLSATYALIEELFLALGVYKHNWYRTWMTPVSLIGYFWLARSYYAWLLKGRVKPVLHYANVFCGMFMLYICTPEPWGFVLAGVQTYRAAQFPEPFIATILIINAVFATLAIASMLAYFLKSSRLTKALVFLGLVGLLRVAYRTMKLFWFESDGWFWVFAVANIAWVYFTMVWIDRWYRSFLTLERKEGENRKASD